MSFIPRLIAMLAVATLTASAAAQCVTANVSPQVARIADLTYLPESPSTPSAGCGWRRIMTDKDFLMHQDESVKLSVFERIRSDGRIERAVVYEGTRNQFDWVHNLSGQGLRTLGTHKAETARVFEQADAWAAGLVSKAKQDGASYVFVGYSRGAEFAQRSAGIHEAQGVTFNGPSMGMGREGLTVAQLQHIRANVIDIHASADPLLLMHWLSQAEPVARTFVVTRAGGTPLVAAKDLISGHSLVTVREALLSRGQLTAIESVDPETAMTLANQVTVLAGGLQRLGQGIADNRKLPLNLRIDALRGADSLERFGDKLGLATEMFGYARAIQADLAASKKGEFVLMRSQMLDSIGTALITGTHVPGLKKLPGMEDGLLPLLVRTAQTNGLLKFIPAVKTSMSDFGALNLIGATRDVVMDKYMSIDAWEKALDGAVGLTWGLVGLRLSGNNHEVAKYTSDAAVALAATSRLALRDTELEFNLLRMFDWSRDPFHQQAGKMIDMYRQHVETAQLKGAEVLPWTRFFGGEGKDAAEKARRALHVSGLSDDQIATVDSISQMASHPVTHHPQRVPVVQPVVPQPADRAAVKGNEGGGKMDMKVDDSHFRQRR